MPPDPARRTAGSRGAERQLLKGAATTLILATLADRPMHGYELIQTIRERTDGIFEFSDGTIYPLLYTLRDRRWLRSVRESSAQGPERKVYSLTPAGRSALGERLDEWRRFARGMDLALGSRG